LVGETEVIGENLPQCHIIYHRTQMTLNWARSRAKRLATRMNVHEVSIFDSALNEQFPAEGDNTTNTNFMQCCIWGVRRWKIGWVLHLRKRDGTTVLVAKLFT
jgi:hypothetical protein